MFGMILCPKRPTCSNPPSASHTAAISVCLPSSSTPNLAGTLSSPLSFSLDLSVIWSIYSSLIQVCLSSLLFIYFFVNISSPPSFRRFDSPSAGRFRRLVPPCAPTLWFIPSLLQARLVRMLRFPSLTGTLKVPPIVRSSFFWRHSVVVLPPKCLSWWLRIL